MNSAARTNKITGVILAGGKSSRMGTDKALLVLNGKPFIKHIADTLKKFFKDVVIIADHVDKYSFLGLKVFPDVIKACGPLGGIHSALSNIVSEYAFIVSCDTPFAPEEAILKLLEMAPQNGITIATDGKNLLTLFGLYPKFLSGRIEDYLQGGKRKVYDFINDTSLKVTVVDLSIWKDALCNINSMMDYLKIAK